MALRASILRETKMLVMEYEIWNTEYAVNIIPVVFFPSYLTTFGLKIERCGRERDCILYMKMAMI